MQFRWLLQVWWAAVATALPGRAQTALLPVLPADCLLVVEARAPGAAVGAILAALGDVPSGLPAEVVGMVGLGLTVLRTTLDGPLEGWVHDVAAGGAAFGLRREGAAWQPLLVVRPGDPVAAERWCAAHRAQLHWHRQGDLWLLAADAAGVERLRAGAAAASAAVPTVDQSDPPGEPAALHGRVDLAAVAAALGGGGLAARQAALDAGQRFLFGPLLSALAQSREAKFVLRAASGLDLQIDVDGSWLGSPWAALLPGRPDGATALPLAEDGILQLALDRSWRELLRGPDRFLSAADAVAVQSFLSIADALDGPASSFVDDLLGGLREPLALHVLPVPLADDDGPRSPIVLPGFVLTAPIASPAVVPVLRRTATMLMTVLNVERQQRRQAPFLVRSVQGSGYAGLVAEAPAWRGPGLPPLETQLSPTLLWGHGHVVLGSVRAAAERVLASAAAANLPPAPAGDRLIVRGAPLAAVLAANRAPLELGRLLDEGEDAAAARRFSTVLAVVVAALQQLEFGCTAIGGGTRLHLRLERRR